MTIISTENLYYCTVVHSGKLSYTFALRVNYDDGSNTYIDIFNNSKLKLYYGKCHSIDDYYIVRITKLNLNNNKIRLESLKEAITSANVIENKINDIYDKKTLNYFN